ncbi:MAG TPA: nucleotidyltransferase [Ruminococcaceae bacterium]|nr:nucleotidyltransferase [Oscillospiraceae bacterium]
MKVYGIVSEYNPFHNGHKFQIDEIRKKDGDCAIVSVMSGNYVQRAETAVMSKYARAKAALLGGVDLVLELPMSYAVSSAERFAYSSVYILNSLGAVTDISFGSECGSISLLQKAAEALYDDNVILKLKTELKNGVSYPAARFAAVRDVFGAETASVLSEPNNILAVEYLKALKALSADIVAHTVKRSGASHDSAEASGNIASASKIRALIRENKSADMFLPAESQNILMSEISNKAAPSDMNRIGNAVIASLKLKTPSDFSNIYGVGEGIENRLLSAAASAQNLTELYDFAKTKRFTYSRIRRVVLNSFFGITNDITLSDPPYIRVLGFTQKGKDVLRIARKNASLPIVMTVGDVKKLGGFSERLYSLECRTTDIFNMTLPKIRQSGTDMTDNLVRIE